MNLLYVHTNLKRRAQFQLQTSILEDKGKKYVQKRILRKESTSHLAQITQNDDIVIKKIPTVVVPSMRKKSKNALMWDYINAPTVLKQLETSLYRKEFKNVSLILENYHALVLKSPMRSCDLSVIEEYERLFDSRSIRNSRKKFDCISIGLIDFIPSNIISHKNKYYLVDNEWVFPWPIPRAYILWRALFYTSVTLQELIRISCSPAFPCKMLTRNLWIPTEWWSILIEKERDYVYWADLESSFQTYVTGITPPQSDYYEEEYLLKDIVVKATEFVSTSSVSKSENTVSTREAQLEADLSKIQSGKFYRIWQAYCKIRDRVRMMLKA